MNSSGFVVLEKIFKWSHGSYFCISVIIFPWKKTWPFFSTILILFTQGRFVPSLIEIGPLVLEKIFFQNEYGFPYYGPSRSPRTMICTNSPVKL
jgi:hypothetical protein